MGRREPVNVAKGGMQQAGHAPESLDSDVLCWAVFSLRDKDWKVWGAVTQHRKPAAKAE